MPRKDPEARRQYEAERNKRPARKVADSVRHKISYKRDPTKARESHLRRRFGITTERYEHMLSQQHGVCAICQQPERSIFKNKVYKSGQAKRLAVDHNHQTNKIRALLCDGCNRGIGYFEEDISRLLAAVAYLERFNQ